MVLGSQDAADGQGAAGDRCAAEECPGRFCRSRGARGMALSWRDDGQVRAIRFPAGRVLPDDAGTRVNIVAEDVPDGISAGLASSPAKLAALWSSGPHRPALACQP